METTNKNTEMRNYPNNPRTMIDPNQDIANTVSQDDRPEIEDGRPEIVQVVNQLQELVRDFKSHSDWLEDLSRRIGGSVPNSEKEDHIGKDSQNLLEALSTIAFNLNIERRIQQETVKRINSLI